MGATISFQTINWKRVIFCLFLFLLPNYLVMKVQLVGPVDDLIGLGTAIDLVILMPLSLYFFGFKKRVSWLVLCSLIFWGLLLSDWMIPNEADTYLTYFNKSGILLEAGIIFFEVILFIYIVKRFPLIDSKLQTRKKRALSFFVMFY